MKGGIPVKVLVGGMMPISILGNFGDPGIVGLLQADTAQDITLNAPGEQVVAVLYRKLRFKWLLINMIDSVDNSLHT